MSIFKGYPIVVLERFAVEDYLKTHHRATQNNREEVGSTLSKVFRKKEFVPKAPAERRVVNETNNTSHNVKSEVKDVSIMDCSFSNSESCILDLVAKVKQEKKEPSKIIHELVRHFPEHSVGKNETTSVVIKNQSIKNESHYNDMPNISFENENIGDKLTTCDTLAAVASSQIQSKIYTDSSCVEMADVFAMFGGSSSRRPEEACSDHSSYVPLGFCGELRNNLSAECLAKNSGTEKFRQYPDSEEESRVQSSEKLIGSKLFAAAKQVSVPEMSFEAPSDNNPYSSHLCPEQYNHEFELGSQCSGESQTPSLARESEHAENDDKCDKLTTSDCLAGSVASSQIQSEMYTDSSCVEMADVSMTSEDSSAGTVEEVRSDLSAFLRFDCHGELRNNLSAEYLTKNSGLAKLPQSPDSNVESRIQTSQNLNGSELSAAAKQISVPEMSFETPSNDNSYSCHRYPKRYKHDELDGHCLHEIETPSLVMESEHAENESVDSDIPTISFENDPLTGSVASSQIHSEIDTDSSCVETADVFVIFDGSSSGVPEEVRLGCRSELRNNFSAECLAKNPELAKLLPGSKVKSRLQSSGKLIKQVSVPETSFKAPSDDELYPCHQYPKRYKHDELDTHCLGESQTPSLVMESEHAENESHYNDIPIISFENEPSTGDKLTTSDKLAESVTSSEIQSEIDTDSSCVETADIFVIFDSSSSGRPKEVRPNGRGELRNNFSAECLAKNRALAKLSPGSKVESRAQSSEKLTKQVSFPETSFEAPSGDKPFMCLQCPERFKHKFELSRHLTVHRNDKPFECNQCFAKFKFKFVLNRPLREYSNGIPFKCVQCSAKFKLKYGPSTHLQPQTVVEDCPATFEHGNSLDTLLNGRTSEGQLECNYCSKKFLTKTCLKKHIFSHDFERPFECDHCPAKFRLRHWLTDHLATHTSPGRFKCNQCPETFQLRRYLTSHLRTHSDLFKCSHCSAKFERKASLNVHLKSHGIGKSFEHETPLPLIERENIVDENNSADEPIICFEKTRKSSVGDKVTTSDVLAESQTSFQNQAKVYLDLSSIKLVDNSSKLEGLCSKSLEIFEKLCSVEGWSSAGNLELSEITGEFIRTFRETVGESRDRSLDDNQKVPLLVAHKNISNESCCADKPSTYSDNDPISDKLTISDSLNESSVCSKNNVPDVPLDNILTISDVLTEAPIFFDNGSNNISDGDKLTLSDGLEVSPNSSNIESEVSNDLRSISPADASETLKDTSLKVSDTLEKVSLNDGAYLLTLCQGEIENSVEYLSENRKTEEFPPSSNLKTSSGESISNDFNHDSLLLEGLSMDSDERPLQRRECPEKIVVSSGQNAHTNEKPYQCFFCPKRFRFRKSLLKHSREHSSQQF